MSKNKLITLLVIGGIIYLAFNKIYIKTSSNQFKDENFTITIDIKGCINCFWLDPDMKKTVKVLSKKEEKIFDLEAATELHATRIIIGKTRENSKFTEAGINWVIIFPNELEKLESFDFETTEDLNKKGDGNFIQKNFYSDNTLEKVLKELEVAFDVNLN